MKSDHSIRKALGKKHWERQLKKEERKLLKPVQTPLPGQQTSVLILVWSLYGGGAERVACILANELALAYHVTMVYFEDKEAVYPLEPDIELFRIPEFSGDAGEEYTFWCHYIEALKVSRSAVAVLSFLYAMNRLNVDAGGPGKTICCERNNPIRKEP